LTFSDVPGIVILGKVFSMIYFDSAELEEIQMFREGADTDLLICKHRKRKDASKKAKNKKVLETKARKSSRKKD